MNLLLTGIGANGLLIQAGVGLFTATNTLPVRTGIVHVDRLTGAPRWFADDLEESLGAMSTGPDGALYLPHAPLRRAFSLALGLTDEPLLGGVSKWAPDGNDLLARDAACAAADRAANAVVEQRECPESAAADLVQIDALRLQMVDAARQAVTEGTLDMAVGRRVRRLAEKLGPAPGSLSARELTRYQRGTLNYPRRAARVLERACTLLTSADGEVGIATGR